MRFLVNFLKDFLEESWKNYWMNPLQNYRIVFLKKNARSISVESLFGIPYGIPFEIPLWIFPKISFRIPPGN